jgi:diguanylate cyclase (GGDEF)-like protein
MIVGQGVSSRSKLSAGARAALVVGLPMAALGVIATVGLSHVDRTPMTGLPNVPWPVIGLFIAIAQSTVVNLQVLREARSVSLTDAPFVLGLFLLGPVGFIAARTLGGFGAQGIARRQYREPVKLAFNTVMCFTEAAIGLLVFLAVDGGHGVLDPRSWAAALVAAMVGNTVSGAAVSVLIGRLEGSFSVRDLSWVAVMSSAQSAAAGCLGLVAVVAVHDNVWMVLPTAVVGTAVVIGYRGYAHLSGRHENLERLYEFGRVVSAHSDSDEVLKGMLEQVCDLLVADMAALTFITEDNRADTEAILRRGGALERRPAELTTQANWLMDRVCEQQEPVRLSRDTRDIAARHWLNAVGLNEAMIVPLVGDTGVLAALTVGDRLGSARGFDRDDVRLLQTVGNHASIALRHGRLMDRLRHDSLHDALTGVANRSYLQIEVERMVEALDAGGAPFAIAMLDLDSFKDVNDTLGHQQGDVLLCEVARRLTQALGRRGTVTRFGGDEFAILLPDCRSDESATRIGRALIDALSEPIDMAGTMLDLGASVGIARAPAHASTHEELMKRADVAMYAAKQAGREVVVFDQSRDTSSPARLAMVAALRGAINDGTIEMHVQPQVDVATGGVLAVEALARWTDPQLGAVSPDEFIPLAERTGLIRPLTELILDRAVAACAEWQRTCPGVAVAVNLSARSLYDEELDDHVGRLLARHRLPARLLTLEITESSVMADPGRTLGLLHRLRLRGVRLSIDDFGTGYSSLSYLRRLPVQEVKVDRSFVQRMNDESDDAAIVQSIVQLGRTLDLSIVAEGVENAAILGMLREMGCDVAQGYFIARPMRAEAFPQWFAATNRAGHGHRLVAVNDR